MAIAIEFKGVNKWFGEHHVLVDVDLKVVVKTSKLVNFSKDAAPLPSMPLIATAINDQAKLLATKDLIPTNLVVSGTKMVLASNDQLTKIGSGGPLGLVANRLLGGSLPGTVVSVTSTTPVLSLLSGATPGLREGRLYLSAKTGVATGRGICTLSAASRPETAEHPFSADFGDRL